MRIKLILINHQVDNQSNFLISIPFSVQTFGEFNEYLIQYFELPQSTHLQFQLDGFCILHKEQIHQMLKECDTLKVTLASQESMLQKRKGSVLSSNSVKKQKKETSHEIKLKEFINDMLQIQKNLESEQKNSDEEDTSSSCSSTSSSRNKKKLRQEKKEKLERQKKFTEKIQRRFDGIRELQNKNFMDKYAADFRRDMENAFKSQDSQIQRESIEKDKINDLLEKFNPNNYIQEDLLKYFDSDIQKGFNSIEKDKRKDYFENYNPYDFNHLQKEALKSLSESNSDSSAESESEIESVKKIGNKKQGNVSAKYQKVLEKEACLNKKLVDKNNQGISTNPIQSIFQKGDTLGKPIETLNAQTKVIQSKNQQQQLATQAIKQGVNNQAVQNLNQQTQQVKAKQAQVPQLNSNQAASKQDNQAKNTNKQADFQKLNANPIQKNLNLTNKVAEKPTLQGVLNKKVARKLSSSDSSSSSSSDDESEPEIAQIKQKIQLSFQKQNEQQTKPIKPTAQQQDQLKNSNKAITPLSKQNHQSEEKPQSNQTTPSSKPTLQPLLKGPKQEHILNLNLKSPLEIYEEKKILWKQISPFITKMDKKLKKQQEQALKSQQTVNQNNTNPQTDQHNQQKHNETHQKIEATNQIQQISIKENDQDQDLPPFDLKGFDKINLKDIVDYEKCLQKNFFNENDQIYFKDVELDEEALCPKLSEWKRGTVTQIINAKKVKLSVSIGGKIESSTLDTSVFKALYLKTSAEQAQEKKEQVQQIKVETKKEDNTKQQETQENNYRAINDKNIFVGRTVNYYYSDKNYFQDKYILEHSNRNQDHYMPLSLLLNFPKIKKEVDTIEDLVQKLQTFMKITNQVIQFELNADKTMIRKKQLKKDQNKDKSQQKQNNQNNNKNQNQKQNSNENNKNNHNNNTNRNGGNVPKLSQSLINQIQSTHKDQASSQLNNNNNLRSQLIETQQLDKTPQKQEKTNENQKENEDGELVEKMEIESKQQNKDQETSKSTQMEEEDKEQKTITQQIVQNVQQQMIKQINELSYLNI
ncbi:hypothetical protein ABPG74_011289 [Tetrahymena malaccensis]